MAYWDGERWIEERAPVRTRRSRGARAFVHTSQALLEGGLIAILVGGLVVGTAFAGKGGGSCAPAAPRVAIENTWAWGQWGSYGTAGQELQFQVSVTNYDVGCRSSTFDVSVSAPDGFAVSLPTSSVSLRSGRTAYLSAWVTSPAGAADGDYAIEASATRSSGADALAAGGSFTSYYKVYSSDGDVPTMYWVSPGDGGTVTGRSATLSATARDNRAVKWVKLFLDGALLATTSCDGITFSCSVDYRWSTSSGQHSATFRASDWMGNVSETTSTFSAN